MFASFTSFNCHTNELQFTFLSQELNYTVTVVATDNGLPENFNATATITVFVYSPDNFFSPVFDQPSYSGVVDEDTPAGFDAVSFTVTDGDQVGPAAEIGRIILSGVDAELFETEITGPNSGTISTK